MTCKTHIILATLRNLRVTGYTGSINPESIRNLTGIERPGTILCDLRKKGYLLEAGMVYLPTHRGTTKANAYKINPESDLMPKDKYDVSTHQSRKRNAYKNRAQVIDLMNKYLLA